MRQLSDILSTVYLNYDLVKRELDQISLHHCNFFGRSYFLLKQNRRTEKTARRLKLKLNSANKVYHHFGEIAEIVKFAEELVSEREQELAENSKTYSEHIENADND